MVDTTKFLGTAGYMKNARCVLRLSHFLTIGEFVAHGANVNCLALSPGNGRTLATGGEDRRVNVWMVGNPTPLLVS